MLSKRGKPYNPNASAASRRLGLNVRNLFASNTVSASQAQELFNDAEAAGVERHNLPTRSRDMKGTNLARDLRKSFLKRKQWPTEYQARIRLLDRHTKEESWQEVALLNVHELLEMLYRFADKDLLADTSLLDPISRQNLEDCKRAAGVEMFAWALHADGVPCNWDRTESCEVVSISMPGLPGKWQHMRIPLTAIPHHAIGPNTWDDLFELIAWSATAAYHGVNPNSRHDHAEWQPRDSARKKKAGTALGAHFCLPEVRGDWKMFADTFHLPRHNELAGICWSCSCTLAEVPICTS